MKTLEEKNISREINFLKRELKSKDINGMLKTEWQAIKNNYYRKIRELQKKLK